MKAKREKLEEGLRQSVRAGGVLLLKEKLWKEAEIKGLGGD